MDEAELLLQLGKVINEVAGEIHLAAFAASRAIKRLIKCFPVAKAEAEEEEAGAEAAAQTEAKAGGGSSSGSGTGTANKAAAAYQAS